MDDALPTSDLTIKPYSRLLESEVRGVFAVRHAVFVVEQGIESVPDRDGLDASCEHVVAVEDRRVVGTARLYGHEAGGVEQIKVGRVAVLGAYRGRGIGRRMMSSINGELTRRGVGGVMHAQAELTGWYASLGWRVVGESFIEAGIAHRKMIYRLESKPESKPESSGDEVQPN